MTKKLKFGLFGLAGLAVAGTAGGVTAGILLNQNQTTLNSNNVSNGSTTAIQNNTTGEYSFKTTYNETNQTFNVSIKEAKSANGTIRLINPDKKILDNGSSIDYSKYFVDKLENVQAGSKVYVAVFTEEGVEARNIKVVGANENISLATQKISIAQPLDSDKGNVSLFSFDLPEKVSIQGDDKETQFDEGFPIDKEGNLYVSATYVKSQLSGWAYNYDYRSYVYEMNSDLVLDDSNEELNLLNQVMKKDLITAKNDTINFIIFLNGHKLSIGTFTIPSGVTVTLINNHENTYTPSEKGEDKNVVTAAENGKGIILGGVIATYSSVKVDAPITSINQIATPR